jgi:zinc/manganese transport system substrate-binding protein
VTSRAHLPRRVLGLLVVIVLASLGAGCSAAGSSGLASGRRVQVVASENIWGSIAAQLGGDHAQVVSIVTNPDTDPHDYEPTPADARTLAEAQEVIENGLGYDSWAAKAVAANQTSGQRVLDVGRLLGLRTGANPHRWYYPDDVTRVAEQITADYQRLDPADAAYFARQRDQFLGPGLARYHGLIAQIRSRYAGTPVGASESIFVGMAQATGLDLLTPPAYLEAISEGTDPTASDRATVDAQLRDHRIRVWVFNSQNATPDIQALTAEARAGRIPVTTVTETLSPARSSFQDWQVAQLGALAAALAQGTGR